METLRGHLILLGDLVSRAILHGLAALVDQDPELARQVSAGDAELNRVRFAIEEKTYALLEAGVLAEPDVRLGVSMVMVGQALEHIGDCAANLAYLALRQNAGPNGTSSIMTDELVEMGQAAAEMTQAAVNAFVAGDVRLAEATVRRDRELNDGYERVSDALLPDVAAERRLMLLWAAHNLQQIGTHATSICERAIFVATGELKEFR